MRGSHNQHDKSENKFLADSLQRFLYVENTDV